MAKPLKIFLGIVGALLVLIVGAAIALPLLFDPNKYREQIGKAVKDETGRELALGNIELKVFPWLRVSVESARLGNAPGFGDVPFAEVGEVSVGVRMMPLIMDQRVLVSAVTLSGLRLNLQKNAEGLDNWSDLAKKDEPATPEPPPEEGGIDIKEIDIAGVEITDSALSYDDAQARKRYTLDQLELKTGQLKPGEAFDLELSGTVTSSAPQASAELELSGHVVPDASGERVGVEDFKLKLKGRGFDLDTEAELAAKIAADLKGKIYQLDDLKLTADLSGAAIPGGKTQVLLTSGLKLDQGQGTLALSNTELSAAGMKLSAQIAGEGLNGEEPRLQGPIRIAEFSPRAVLTAFGQKPQTADPNALASARLSAEYSGDFKSASLRDLKLNLDQTTVSGHLNIRDFATQALEFALKVDQIDADRYLAPKAPESKPAGTPAAAQESLNDIKLPTEAIEKLNANGSVDIGTLKINGLKLSDVRLKLSGGKGGAKNQELSARLYGGSVTTTSRIVPGKQPDVAVQTRLSALNAAPFLQDLVGRDMVSGIGSLTLDITGRGDTVGAIRRSLNGDVALKLENGAVKGFNLASIVRKAKATVGGNLNYTETEPQQTDFTAVSFAGKIVNGILKSDQLDGASPLFRLAGSGEIDLVNETFNYLAKPTIVETTKGQGGKELEELKGVTIPIRLTGTFSDPKYKVEIADALKARAKQELKQEYEKQEDKAKEKLKEKLGEYLFGKPKPAPAPAPAPEPQQQPAPEPGT